MDNEHRAAPTMQQNKGERKGGQAAPGPGHTACLPRALKHVPTLVWHLQGTVSIL